MFKQAQLETVPPFDRLTPAARHRLAKVAKRVELEPGSELIHEGEFALELYAIVDGHMDVSRAGDVVGELGPGDCFGEVGVLPHGGLKWGKRSATVAAASRVSLVAIPGYEVRQLVEEMPEIGAALLEAARRRGTPIPH